jgi:hypothetical protein
MTEFERLVRRARMKRAAWLSEAFSRVFGARRAAG